MNTYVKRKDDFCMNTNNVDMSKLLEVLSKMDKKELEAGIAKANQILKGKNKNEIFDQFKNK